jgi:hypothetical protein
VNRRPEAVQDLAPGAEAGAVRLVDDDQVEEVGGKFLEEAGSVGILAPQSLVDGKV